LGKEVSAKGDSSKPTVYIEYLNVGPTTPQNAIYAGYQGESRTLKKFGKEQKKKKERISSFSEALQKEK